MKARNKTRITASGMKFFKRAAAFAGLKERRRKGQNPCWENIDI
jgi:hypothetical protein